jgi:transmembrane sensor
MSARVSSTIRETAAAWITRRDAGLSAAEERELKAWLAADPRHRSAFAEHGKAWSLLDRPVQGGAADEILHELQRLDRRRRTRRALVASVAAMMLIAGASLWMSGRGFAPERSAAVVATTRVVLPERQTLEDGSVVELREGAQISVNFTAAQRRVALLRGEAHFQVAKNPARPFIVEASGVELRAVGTAFAVQIDRVVDVVVTEGHVAVDARPATTARASSEPPAQAILSRGQQALVESGSIAAKVRALSETEMTERLSWRAPRLEFSGTPLAEVVARLNHHAALRGDVRLTIGDAAIADVQVSGLFRVDNTAALLDLLENAFGISAERTGAEIVLRRVKGK